MLWDPIRYLECCPSSDGACAMVLAAEDALGAPQAPPAWIHATAMRSEPTMFAGRDEVNPLAGRECAAELYRQWPFFRTKMLVASISAVVKSSSMVDVTCSTHETHAASPKTWTSGRLIATRICKVERKIVAQLS